MSPEASVMTSLQARSHGINGIQEVQGDNRLDCTLVHRDLAEAILGAGRTNPCSKESWDGPRILFLGDRAAFLFRECPPELEGCAPGTASIYLGNDMV